MVTVRLCVVCAKAFTPEVEDQWWCSEEHHESLEEIATMRVDEQAELKAAAKEEIAEVASTSEAEKARRAMAGGHVPMHSAFDPKSSSLAELLEASSVLSRAAMRLSGVEDAYLLAGVAQAFLERVTDRMEVMLGSSGDDPNVRDAGGPDRPEPEGAGGPGGGGDGEDAG